MSKKLPIFYSALLLTGVNLLLRFVGTSFQVYLSSRIGPEGIGLLQLVLSVNAMATVAGMAGIRTATMYLTADELGRRGCGGIRRTLSFCIGYSILCSGFVSLIVYRAAPFIAQNWIGNTLTADALRLFSFFLPVICLTGVMTGYFTGAQRIGTLAAVEVAEQLLCILCTLSLLKLAGNDAARCCQSVIAGSGIGSCLTLMCLMILQLRMRMPPSPKRPIVRQLLETAVPLAIADDLKTGINTVENLMVPKRLALFTGIASPLAAFGTVSGMVFPILMFPSCLLYGLAELLIPELARCAAGDNHQRIGYLTSRTLKITAIYGLLLGGLEFLLANRLTIRFYQSIEAGQQLRLYSLLIPMLYCDILVDAMTKGLGQQKICVRYNIITSIMDVLLLYILLPEFGMVGYFISFFITHLINFILSLHRLLLITKLRIPFSAAVFGLSAALSAILLISKAPGAAQPLLYPITFFCLLILFQVVDKRDILWVKSLLLPAKKHPLTQR